MNEAAQHFLPAPKARAPEPSGFRFPGPDDRVTINGMTGSGKTTFALWLFAECADFDRKPWILIDYKGEDQIGQIIAAKMAEIIKTTASIPKTPGIYVVRPSVRDGQGPIIDFLWRVYEKGRTGLFLDEATMIPELRGEGNSGGPFQSLLSQGRSKHIPVWVLAQRPVGVNKMVYSESNFLGAFRLKRKADLDKIREEVPEDSIDYQNVWVDWQPQGHYSRWYDDHQNKSFKLTPVPGPQKILDLLGDRVDNLKKRETI